MQPLELRDHVKGEMHPRHKLTRLQVQTIRGTYGKGGVSQQALAEEYAVEQTTIGQIIRGENWKHLNNSGPIRRPDYPRLSPEQVTDIRLKAKTVTSVQLAEQFHISDALISGIVKNRLYPDPNYSPPRGNLRPSRLDDSDLANIRKLASEGASIGDIAKKFAINYQHVWKLVQDHSYHVKKPKFTSEQIRTIRERYAKGDITQPKLAAEFGVSFSMISNITRGISYQDVGKEAT
jgi:DNA-binding transcriptional regulator YiaG